MYLMPPEKGKWLFSLHTNTSGIFLTNIHTKNTHLFEVTDIFLCTRRTQNTDFTSYYERFLSLRIIVHSRSVHLNYKQ